jgi:hypothetical protein
MRNMVVWASEVRQRKEYKDCHRKKTKLTIQIPYERFPHLMMLHIKLDPDGHQHFRFISFLHVDGFWSVFGQKRE